MFSFSLTTGSNFSFSLDTREMAPTSVNKDKAWKKKTPSTIRRNARRREEFLRKKQSPAAVPGKEKLAKCDFSSVSQRGLKVHVGRNHKVQQAAATEILRGDREEVELNISQQSEVTREEVGEENGEPVSPPQPPWICLNCGTKLFDRWCCEQTKRYVHRENAMCTNKTLCPDCCEELDVCDK